MSGCSSSEILLSCGFIFFSMEVHCLYYVYLHVCFHECVCVCIVEGTLAIWILTRFKNGNENDLEKQALKAHGPTLKWEQPHMSMLYWSDVSCEAIINGQIHVTSKGVKSNLIRDCLINPVRL